MRAITDALAAALALAAEGVPVFPCGQAKRPTCPHGFKDATADAAAVRDLWRRHPGPLVAFPTGGISDRDVLDLDTKHREAVAWWTENRDRLPPTRTHRTRSGGLHLLFRHADGARNTQSKIAPGLDTRGDGGYAIHWPSAGLAVLRDAPLALWPHWLLDEVARQPETLAARSGASDDRGHDALADHQLRDLLTDYGEAALRSAADKILSAPNGKQEWTLNAECFSIGRLAAAGGVPAALALDILLTAARTMDTYDPARPWNPEKIEKKVRRAFDQGMAMPRPHWMDTERDEEALARAWEAAILGEPDA